MKSCKICNSSFKGHHLQLCCSDACKKTNEDRIKKEFYVRAVVPTLKGRKPKQTLEEKRAYEKEYNNSPERKLYMKEYRKPEERRVKERASGREYKKRNLDTQKNGHLKRGFGITLEDFNNMLESQNSVCAICNCPESKVFKKTGKIVDMCVDHCHKTGKVRGLLCWGCNTSLGKFKDSIENLQNAINYLKKHTNE